MTTTHSKLNSMLGTSPLLRIAGLSLTSPSAPHRVATSLIEALNLQVNTGECWAIIGRNGAGKSTLLKTIAGLLPCPEGVISISGKEQNVWSLKERAKQCAYLPQQHIDAFSYSVEDLVLASRYPHVADYWENQAELETVQGILKQLDISHLATRDIRTLSGGERQRVGIAALLAQDTPLLLLDEPANALDLAHQMQLLKLLQQLTHQNNKGIVFVSHDLNFALQVATHTILLHDDATWQAGSIYNILTPEAIAQSLGYPVQKIELADRVVFVPQLNAGHF